MIYYKDGEILPVFPLPNTLLFPSVSLPLHIFEPRYRQMITDILDNKGVLCLATISEEWLDQVDKDFLFYPMGSVCRLSRYVHLKDGCFNIMIKSLSRCVISDCRYRKDRLYRSAKIAVKSDDLKKKLSKADEDKLRKVAMNFFRHLPIDSTAMEIKKHFEKLDAMHVMNILCVNAMTSLAEKHAIFSKDTMLEICEALLEHYKEYGA